MSKPVKTKLCWNCEGNVSRFAENCPYCAVYLSPDTDDLKDADAFTSAVPYRAEKSTSIPKAPYTPSEEVNESQSYAQEAVLPKSTGLLQATFVPLILLTTGLICLFFALMLVLFSENGKLTLQWDAELWYVYGIIALPLLFFGWKSLDQSITN